VSKERGVYLLCILDCIAKVRDYTRGGSEEFFRDSRTQDAVIRNIEVIGQAV
jgi:uncharacterized protein with HEPN domain